MSVPLMARADPGLKSYFLSSKKGGFFFLLLMMRFTSGSSRSVWSILSSLAAPTMALRRLVLLVRETSSTFSSRVEVEAAVACAPEVVPTTPATARRVRIVEYFIIHSQNS